MRVSQAVFLGLVQGLTEFLPVSSSGHLVIGQKLLKLSHPPVLFDILVHCGTLLAIVFYFNKRLINFYKNINNLKLIILGSIPAALLGLLLNDYLETTFNSLLLVGLSLLATAGLLFSTRLVKKTNKDKEQLKAKDSFIIGCFQALALLPGISRSGSTIVSGLFRGLKKESAFLFSFYLGAPAMIGALILQVPNFSENSNQLGMGLIGLITAMFSGLLSLKLLEKVVIKGKLSYFGIYCLILGVAVLILSF